MYFIIYINSIYECSDEIASITGRISLQYKKSAPILGRFNLKYYSTNIIYGVCIIYTYTY
ncbi:MAG: hypothetical protein Mars2KO_10470 [Maribacter sp.]